MFLYFAMIAAFCNYVINKSLLTANVVYAHGHLLKGYVFCILLLQLHFVIMLLTKLCWRGHLCIL